jgi:hypothetical protein
MQGECKNELVKDVHELELTDWVASLARRVVRLPTW